MSDAGSRETHNAADRTETSEQAYERLGHRHEGVLNRILDLKDYRRLAKPHLPRTVYGWAANGLEADVARDGNRKFARVLRDVSKRLNASELFGHRYGAQLRIAPTPLGDRDYRLRASGARMR